MNKLPNTFCALPWINLSTDVNGSLRPCCKFAQPSKENEFQLPNMKEGRLDVLWNDARYQKLRQAFLDGLQPKECKSCWDEEQAGMASFRVQFARDKKIDLTNLEFNTITNYGPKALDFKLNNVCNLKCRICGTQASSTYLKEYQERLNIKIEDSSYWLSNKILGTENEDVIKEWANDLIHLEITGGEPMASPENIKVLELLIGAGRSSHITILLNTNGTLYNKKFIDCLVKFKEVTICLSIDDLHGRFEYERYPAEWKVVQENLQKFIALRTNNKNIFLTLCPTVSSYNVFYLNEYLEWSEPLGIFTYFNILHYDPAFSIKNLPNEVKKTLNYKLQNRKFEKIKNFLNLPQDREGMIYDFINKTITIDKWREQNFRATFGEWGEIIWKYLDEQTN